MMMRNKMDFFNDLFRLLQLMENISVFFKQIVLVVFYDISNLVGYLMSNLFYIYIYIYIRCRIKIRNIVVLSHNTYATIQIYMHAESTTTQ